MIKKSNIIISALFLLLLVVPLVSGNSFDFDNAKYQVTRVIDSALGMLSPVLEKIMGDYTTSEFFFHKILLLVLLIIITKNILDRTPIGEGNKKVSLIVSLIVSILAIRFINENSFFEAIFIQYGVLGIAITTILPMVIFFYFIHNTKVGTFGRKVFWTLYATTMTGIWIVKSSEIPEVANWIYGITLLASIVFIFFDSSIHSYFGLSDFKKFERHSNKKRIREAKEELDKIEEHFQKRRMTFAEYKKEKKELEDYIKELSKE
jgi:hypothetical protein